MTTNRVEFHMPQTPRQAVPASRCIVFLDGRLCPYLSVTQIVRAAAPEHSRAHMAYDPAAWPHAEQIPPEHIEKFAAMGRRVRIASICDGGMGAAAAETVTLFAGRIEQIHKTLGGDREGVEIVAEDFAARLRRITVFGTLWADRRGGAVRLDAGELIFNRSGLPNASRAAALHQGKAYRMFESDPARAVHWTCAAAVRYLLSEHLVTGELASPCIEQLEALFARRTLGTLDVTGATLLRAIEHCCDSTPVTFRFEPSAAGEWPDERIVFYRPGDGRPVELTYQRSGERMDLTRTNIRRAASRKTCGPVTHRFVGWGGVKMYEATFSLVKAWDPALEGAAQSVYAPSTNADFDSVRDVYRRWCLNEAGDYTAAPFLQGEPFDFSRIFERTPYVQRRRRFENTLTTRDGASLGRHLEMSIDGGGTWQPYPDAFDVLSDECGVWLSSDPLSTEVWSAIAAGTLRFRMTAAVAGDARLTVTVADGPVDAAIEVVDHLIEAPRFQYSKVTPESVFYRGTHARADERDDSEALHAYVRHKSVAHDPAVETLDVETPLVAQCYMPGDCVTSGLDGRDVLGTRSDGQTLCLVERATVDYQRQCTRLHIVRRRRKS
ncbi:MAG: hypothetical protein IH624_17400 [Phycisphaerae bacterium]|nr:hypothetical protein [Phycisphaerae bacterium]